MNIISIIADELSLQTAQVKNTIDLLDDDKTIPFIARYRKEATRGLDDLQIHQIKERLTYLRQLVERKATVLESIESQGKLTGELRSKIGATLLLTELEDLYLPYKPKKRTRAMIAKEKGLEPLAAQFLAQEATDASVEELCEPYIDFEHDLFTKVDVLKGVNDIIAEQISEDADIRSYVREFTAKSAQLVSKQKGDETDNEFAMYAEYNEAIKDMPPHRILAMFRGEKKGVLSVKLDVDTDQIAAKIAEDVIYNPRSEWAETLQAAVSDSYKRLISPAIEREIRASLTEKAELHAIDVFGENLKNLLLQAPVAGKVILGLDPGFRTGTKVTVVNEHGVFLDGATIYPHAPQNRWDDSKNTLAELIQKYDVDVLAVGNGTASRETEQLSAELIKDLRKDDLAYVIVNEAGASVYSASEIAREEFPDMDVSMRGAVSIARRLQDPLAELVKIDPKSIGVGLYQHDVDQKKLVEKLDFIIEYCVNHVGVDLNTASAPLLTHVAGLTKRTAKNIVAYKESHGQIKTRKELLKVTGIGAAAFEQCAGFLRISGGENPLDNTAIHPESYSAAEELVRRFKLSDMAQGGSVLKLKMKAEQISPSELASELAIGEPTLVDILDNLEKPGRDPREAMEKPILRNDVLNLADLTEGMWLKGTVRNVVDFGAFVDIGLKNDGLVHISQLANRFVKNPADIVAVGDVVDVRVLNIDSTRQRVGLSMKK